MKKKILPPTYFMLCLIMLIAMHFIYPIRQIIIRPYAYIGIIPILFGVIINIQTDYLFKKVKTTVDPTENPRILIIDGPFKISRNPMYLGMVTILIGASILLGSLVTFISPLFFIIISQVLFIPIEEKKLEQIFGEKYFDYKKETKRWL